MKDNGKRRYYVHMLYDLFFNKKGFLMVCQEMGLEKKEYLDLKREVSKKGGSLFRIKNNEIEFSWISSFFAGTTLWVYWPHWMGFEEYKKEKKRLEENSCIFLCLVHEGRFHYVELFEINWKASERKKIECFEKLVSIRQKVFGLRFFGLKKLLKLYGYANIASAKKES